MMDAGIVVTVNSDDPAYFAGYINENFMQTFAALGLSAQHAYSLAHNSFEASFIDPSLRRNYIEHLNSVFEIFHESTVHFLSRCWNERPDASDPGSSSRNHLMVRSGADHLLAGMTPIILL
jgi:adenosine deaminase